MLYNCTMLHVTKIKCLRFAAAAPVSSCFPSEMKKNNKKQNIYVCADGLEQPQHQIPHFH